MTKIMIMITYLLSFGLVWAIEIDLEKTLKKENKMIEFEKIDVQEGKGREAEKGLNISVHYSGWIYDDSKSDKKGVSLIAPKTEESLLTLF